jgi:hypothetical protein
LISDIKVVMYYKIMPLEGGKKRKEEENTEML